MSMTNSIKVHYNWSISQSKLYPRSSTSRMAISKPNGEINLWGEKIRVRCDNKTKRNSFVVYATGVPGTPPPPNSNPMSWIIGLVVVSFILPFFSNKWGSLSALKNRVQNAVQTVENVVEAVEKVAEEVEKTAEDIANKLPEGKLRNLAEKVEDVADKAAKAADSLDNIIDKVQEAEAQVDDKVESIVEAKNSPQEEKSN